MIQKTDEDLFKFVEDYQEMLTNIRFFPRGSTVFVLSPTPFYADTFDLKKGQAMTPPLTEAQYQAIMWRVALTVNHVYPKKFKEFVKKDFDLKDENYIDLFDMLGGSDLSMKYLFQDDFVPNAKG